MPQNKDERSKAPVDKSSGKKKASPPRRRRTRLLALEPRVLFDGALAADISAQVVRDTAPADAGPADTTHEFVLPAATTTAPVDTTARPSDTAGDKGRPDDKAGEREKLATDIPGSTAHRNEIVFVDTSVEDYQSLIADVNPDAKIVLLDTSSDGIQQILANLQGEENVDAIHIVSHGTDGVLQLGSTRLDTLSMAKNYSDQLSEIGKHLGADADILVYGCDFGKGDVGRAAATELSALTGADVAASTDRTGSADLGGDWNLELNIGAIETDVAFGERVQSSYSHVLETLDWDKVDWTTSATSGSYTVGGGDVSISLTGNTNRLNTNYPDDQSTLNTGNLPTTQEALQIYALSFQSTAEYVDITINFNHPGGVSNVSFDIFDIDTGGSGGFIDKITITGTSSSGALNPSSVTPDSRVTTPTWTLSGGNTLTGNTAASNTGTGAESGTAVVNFAQSGITQIVIRYQNGTANTGQAIALHDLSFDEAPSAPQIDLNGSDAKTYAEEAFGSAAYNTASTGAIAWNGNWTESDATQSATAGNVLVTGGELRMTGANATAQRAVNLGSYATDHLDRFSFDYRTSSTADAGTDLVYVQVSSNGGSSWTTIDTLDLGASASGNASYDISPYATANTVVRLATSASGFTTAGEYFYADNVRVTAQPTSHSATFTEGGAAVNIANSDASINDDSANMSGAVIDVTNYVSGDVLSAVTTGTNITATYDGAGLLTLSGTDTRANYQAVLRSVQYSSTSDDPTAGGTNTARTITVRVTDSTAQASNTARSTITVAGVNDAPTLADTTLALNSVLEDAAAPTGAVGTLVSSLVGGVSDVDSSSLGIAITATDTSKGTWYYSTNNGGTWTTFTASTASSRLLAADANTRIFFRPTTANYNGSIDPAITFRAWDRSSGTNGGTASTATTGGATPYSTATDTASIVVTPVNDAPTGANKSISMPDSVLYTYSVADFGFADATDTPANSLSGVVVSTVPTGGSLKLNGVTVTAGTTITVADINAGRFQYQADTGNRSWTFKVVDDGGTANSGVNTDATARTMTMNTDQAANDAPTLGNTALAMSVAEDAGTPSGAVGSLISAFTGGITDGDANAQKGIAITASDETNGTWYYTIDGGATWTAVGTVSTASSLLLADNANTRLYFAPKADYNGTAASALTVRAWDQTSGINGNKVSTATTGGTTAFSTATDVIDVSITSVADIVGDSVVGSSRVDLQACKLEYSIVSPK